MIMGKKKSFAGLKGSLIFITMSLICSNGTNNGTIKTSYGHHFFETKARTVWKLNCLHMQAVQYVRYIYLAEFPILVLLASHLLRHKQYNLALGSIPSSAVEHY